MVGLQASGEVLRAEHLEVFVNLEDFGFSVQMVYGRHLDAASGDAEDRVLNSLKSGGGTAADVWEPYWRCICDE